MTTTTPAVLGVEPPSAMASALHSEWIKFSTIRSNRIILALTVAIGIVTTWGSAVFVKHEVLTIAEVFIFPVVLTAVLAAVAGILVFTSEVQHGTLAAALTARPDRRVVVAAKAVVAAGFGLALGVIGMITGFAGSVAGGLGMGDTSGMATTPLWALVYTSGAGLLGLGVGMIVRHSAGAIAGILVWWMVVENLILQFAPAKAVRFLPFDAGYRLLGMESDFDSPEILAATLTRPQYALIFGTYAVGAAVIGTVLLQRRDVS